jgi:thiamine-monophosphate kinase
LGELRIIEILESSLGTSRDTVVGFGDDVSAVKLVDGKVAVLKTDMLVASTDVPPGMSMRQVARKAVVANVSDFAAKGVRPFAGLVALGLPITLREVDIRGIAAGLSTTAREYGLSLVGGDTNESKDLTISLALFAVASQEKLVLRSGAEEGDVVAVSGDFGSASAGLKALLQHRIPPSKLTPALYDAVYNPRAELDLGLRLGSSRSLTASIDSSDGLAWSLHELSRASDVGMLIDHVPVSRAARQFAKRYKYKAEDLALYGGEEYIIVGTMDSRRYDEARGVAENLGGELIAIGETTRAKGRVLLETEGKERKEIEMRGWIHTV